MTLRDFKTQHEVTVHTCTGAGHWHSHMAFFRRIRCHDGVTRTFTELQAEYSMEALTRRHKIAEGADSLDACRNLALLNGLEPPTTETPPKPRMTPEQRQARVAERQRNNERNRCKNAKRDRVPR